MKTITVNASRDYQILIERDLIPTIGAYTAAVVTPGKAALICDSNVWPLYGETAIMSLQKAGFETFPFVFPSGEASKNPQTYFNILNFLAENQLTRSDVIVALGGGVTGDMAGFAAATYLRGIAYIQVPTSLLAMVDSSVGGKTAIDLPAGKNLVGAFYQPHLVLCDINALSTLPQSIFRDGCAEIIKYGVLYDAKLFAHLASHGTAFNREYVIARCVELKRNVVAEDEFDTGARQKLNLGHTIGHSIEALSGFHISHGQAVALGMDIISKASASMGYCSTETYRSIHSILDKFSLSDKVHFTSRQLYTAALSDKKRSGGTVNLIIPQAIGNCMLCPLPVENLQSFIEAGL